MLSTKGVFWTSLALGLICPTLCLPSQPSGHSAANVAAVHILVMDTYGNSLSSFEVELVNSSGSKLTVTKSGVIQLPFGEYRLKGRASLHHRIDTQLSVNTPTMLKVVCFSYNDPGLSQVVHSTLHGELHQVARIAGPLWVRAVALRSEYSNAVEVRADGSFSIQDVPYGDYLLTVFRGGSLLVVQPFSFTVQEEKALIKLPQEAGREAGRLR